MKKLEHLLSKIEQNISQFENENIKISHASVGWHLEHSMLVLNGVIEAIEASKPEEYNYTWNLNRVIVMTTGLIPRGKAKAPKSVKPIENFDEKSLILHLAKTRENISNLMKLDKNQYFPHPYLGHMKLKPTIKFLGIHTKHHLKIVEDILNQ